MRPLLHQPCVIDDPGFDRSLLLHGGQRVLAHRFQNVFIPPGGVSHHVVQRLMGLAHIVGAETSRHRFHALAFPGKQQAGAIGLQRDHAIPVPRGLRQAIQIGREAFLLGAWRNRMGAHDQQLNIKEWQTGWFFSSRYSVYNTVVLGVTKPMRTDHVTGFLLILIAAVMNGAYAIPMKFMSRWKWENIWLVWTVLGLWALPLA